MRSHLARREAERTPVQTPFKFELVINLKIAKKFGLTVVESAAPTR